MLFRDDERSVCFTGEFIVIALLVKKIQLPIFSMLHVYFMCLWRSFANSSVFLTS